MSVFTLYGKQAPLFISVYQKAGASFSAPAGFFLDFYAASSADADNVSSLYSLGSAFGRLPVHFRPFVLHGRHHFGAGNAEADQTVRQIC